MSAEARANGWRGFEGLGTKVDRVMGVRDSKAGTEYTCDGMPTMMGCRSSVVISRPWSKVGLKSTGWLVCYGQEPIDDDKPMDDPENLCEDEDIVLTFCPSCAAEVAAQTEQRSRPKTS